MYRKDLAQLTDDELDRLVNAFNALNASVEGGAMDEYASTHESSSWAIHGGPAFLPWHRFFLREIEKKLQSFDATVTLPYWDWTRRDSRNLDVGGRWQSFLGGRGGTGRFNWSFERATQVPSGQRLPSMDHVIGELRDKNSYYEFRSIERGSHDPGHRWIGGDMSSMRSPIDPLFYLHHCNLDRLWAIWQKNNEDADDYSARVNPRRDDPNTRAAVAPDSKMFGLRGVPGVTPNSVQDHTSLGYRYPRDVRLEAAWHEKGYGALLTGDAESKSDLFIRDSPSDTGAQPSSGAHWVSPDIWVRSHAPRDGEPNTPDDHEQPVADQTNHMYVRVHNRGSEPARGVVVQAYRCRPGTGMLWPMDFDLIGERSVPGNIEAGGNAVAGPFDWIPRQSHECLFAVAESADDPSTTPTFTNTVYAPHWHLVRFDNNVGQRNVSPILMPKNGKVRRSIRISGGSGRSVNDFELDATALPADTALRLRVANSVLKNPPRIFGFSKVATVGQFTFLQTWGGRRSSIRGFPLAAREKKTFHLEVDFAGSAQHERRYAIVARQVQDGQVAGQITFELTAVHDSEDYVFGNPRSRELHRVGCPFWYMILPEHKVPFLTIADGLRHGYNGCRFCLPRYDTG